MQIQISVIIVNFNGQEYFKNCLNSLFRSLTGISHEIIVVDNDSTDGSCNYLEESYPMVRIIRSKKNLGFGVGNNLGVSKAKGKAILLLNNDTILLDHLSTALKILYEDKNHGIITINMLNAQKNYISAVGRFPSPFRLIRISFLNYNREVFKSGRFDKKKYYVDWVTGAFMLMRKADYLKVNGFDPDYFMYVEDVDLCKKIKVLGKKRVFLPNLNYIHFVGFNKTREILLIKGYKTYASKHFNKWGNLIAKAALKINLTAKTLLK
jgi:GT2 family glycosyltransferase